MRVLPFLLLACLVICASASATAPVPRELVKQVVEAAGGEAQLLSLFSFRERILVTDSPAPPVTPEEKGNRTSIVEVGGRWWIGNNKRNKDKVRVLCWAWSLRILLDPQSTISQIPNIDIDGMDVWGLRVTDSVKTPLDLYFDKDSSRLVAIDYDDTRHFFSDWRETSDGRWYPSHVVGVRFENRDAGKLKAKQWYQTDILELTPLTTLPSELKE